MKELANKFVAKGAIIRPANENEILSAERQLGIKFSSEYRDFLSSFGILSYNSDEIYGLGVSTDYYLNILNLLKEFKEYNVNIPNNHIPLLDIGDGQYYIYDNNDGKIYVWSASSNSIIKNKQNSLTEFLLDILEQ
ncbi:MULTISPECIES: SMI1/KNR4 family protein [unclassified Avibacterium]|uniref:SMI1/KNR4 family protein n=1 Tax=unclassified Avibacterium TaxID=2685287 RepID=UPI002026A139|nr:MULTISPECIES: SMI1/KNR4 family protein [unclassified Avibacterium]MCW9699522.1 SMI1/KNR4 family protein [Avibacterium sp. 20-129]URL06129.1 SMI1/KNR4 family protein [Avibacterium sp. 21-595]